MTSVGKRPLQGTKLLVRIARQPFPRGMDNAAAHDTGGIAAKAHANGERLLTARTAALESVIQIVGDARQIADVLQQSE